MSFFDWLVAKPVAPRSTVLPSDGLSVPSLQVTPPKAPLVVPESNLKAQRQERREQLYTVVRDAMLRSGVLAASYKFKVLSLDQRGRQFLVMVDMLHSHALAGTQFMEIEHWIAANAAQQHDLQVKGIYWRVNDTSVQSPMAPEVQKRSLESAALHPPTRSKTGVFEPIGRDEVLAFKQAVAAGAVPVPNGEVQLSGSRRVNQVSEFADTELLEPDDAASPLSRTQFGGL
jgi:hypothetical protein